MRIPIPVFLALLAAACAFGPTPERVGFNYPDAGIRFSPLRGVACRAMSADAAPLHPDSYVLLFPRMTGTIEEGGRRLLFSGVKGDVDLGTWPLFDELSVSYFGADPQYSFEPVEEKEIDVPWPGISSKTGRYRLFHMVPLVEGDGNEQYCFAVTVREFGNTYEILWRDGWNSPPDEEKLEAFFHWTRGLRFRQPEVPPAGEEG
jgi:hypothetical protein